MSGEHRFSIETSGTQGSPPREWGTYLLTWDVTNCLVDPVSVFDWVRNFATRRCLGAGLQPGCMVGECGTPHQQYAVGIGWLPRMVMHLEGEVLFTAGGGLPSLVSLTVRSRVRSRLQRRRRR